MNLLIFSVSFTVGVCIYHLLPYFPLLTITAVCVALWVINKSKGLSVGFLCISILAGLMYCYLRLEPYAEVESLLGKRLELTFICPETRDGRYAIIQKGDIRLISDADTGSTIRLRSVRVFSDRAYMKEGPVYKAIGTVAADSFYVNPGHYSPTVVLRIEDIKEIGLIQKGVIVATRDALNRRIEDLFSRDVATFIKAIVTGSRSDTPEEIREAFNRTGLAHILSISGAHFGLLMVSVFWSVRMLLSLLPERLLIRLTLYVSPNSIAAIITMPVVIAYFLLSSMSHPALRAFIMIGLFLIGLLVERQRYLPHSLALAAFAILLIDPEAITDLSFQLSFLSVLSIAIGLRYFDQPKDDALDEQRPILKRLLSFVKNSLVISLSATFATAPLVAYYFHYLSLISPLTNLIVAPFIGSVILPLSILSSMVFVATGWFPLNGLIAYLVEIMLRAVTTLSSLPFAYIPVPALPTILPLLCLLVVLVAAFVMLPQRGFQDDDFGQRRRLLRRLLAFSLPIVLLVLAFTYFPERGLLKVTFLDVGQGDSAVVELPDRKVLVIDTGKNGYALAGYLRYRGIREIDALVISHPQRDHAGGLYRIVKEFKVLEVWDNGGVYYPPEIASMVKTRSLSRGDLITGRGYNLLVLHPHRDFNPERDIENNLSLVLKLTGNRASFLFTGDIEKGAIEDILHLGSHLKSNVLKFPHHGSSSSLDEGLLGLIQPDIVVISVGKLNRYNFPSRRTLAALYDRQVLRTDLQGAIGFVENRDGRLIIKTAMEMKPQKISDIGDEWRNIRILFKSW